jgi:hypothetical protein
LLGGVSFEAFRFDHPRLNSSLSLAVLPSVTDFGRVRAEFNGRIRYEIFKDFYITLHVFDHFDSRPGGSKDNPDEVSKNDYGIELTISYSFR